MLRLFFSILVGIGFPTLSHAQDLQGSTSLTIDTPQIRSTMPVRPLHASDLLVPALGLGYGIASMHIAALANTDRELQTRWANTNSTQRIRLDDYMHYLPAVYALGKISCTETRENRTRLLGTFLTTKFIQYGSVFTTKRIIGRLRPDASSSHSLPSGHTAEAFANAEFLRMYVGKKQPWIAVLGYVIAAGTGFLRIYNNRHWFSDVVAGAAVGYGTARVGSWTFDRLNRLFQQRKASSNQVLEAPSF
jgi:membrane-associated phospholipid phosphatase